MFGHCGGRFEELKRLTYKTRGAGRFLWCLLSSVENFPSGRRNLYINNDGRELVF